MLAVACLAFAAYPAAAAAGPAMRLAERQLARAHAELAPGSYPSHTTPSGRWQVTGPRAWTSGFLSGAMWLTYARTGDSIWRRRAALRQPPVDDGLLRTANHDVGFMVMPAYVRGWGLTARPAYRRSAMRAARFLASRFDPDVGATRSWGAEGRRFTVIVDNLMNIELLFWGARHGGPRAWRRMAHRHALTTLRDHVRPDGSTYHVVDYDADTGALLDKRTVQGASRESTWSRGQAWAIRGFTVAYRQTGDRRLLHAARRAAVWWLRHLPQDDVPFWDFDAPALARGVHAPLALSSAGLRPPERDSSAAAIAASGLLDLALLEAGPRRAGRFREAAVATLRSLASRRYLASGGRARSILLRGTGDHDRGTADRGLIFGDYYFLEALARARLDL